MTPAEEAAMLRRRRARNWAVMAALLGLVVLFYLIAIARMSQTG
ncbi:hypothetical protein [Roseomonas elaeocarpi]|uniref:Protoheme IX farnesyltransferase n=1 Tax=Roseomonas elaeocarpi TaxID=907779 RepID=A0ABV6JZ76_9PROT